MRNFNTEDPVVAEDHYCIPPLQRVDSSEILERVRDKRYFVLHAPRQTGKTSILLALRDLLNSGPEGRFRCVHVNVEAAQAAGENVECAVRSILSGLASRARLLGDGFLEEFWPAILAKSGAEDAFGEALTRWCEASPTPLVLLIDEIDALIGDSLLSVRRQWRAHYDLRPKRFPQSVVLCDVRDYRIRSRSENAPVAGGSAFDIKAEPLRIGDFTQDQVCALLAQHTEETGQAFTPEALDTVWRQTRGQPWLVNALCRRACFDGEAARDRSRAVTSSSSTGVQKSGGRTQPSAAKNAWAATRSPCGGCDGRNRSFPRPVEKRTRSRDSLDVYADGGGRMDRARAGIDEKGGDCGPNIHPDETAGLRDLLLRLADRYLFAPLWSADIHAEWKSNLLADRPDVDPDVLDRIRTIMDPHFPDPLVTGYENLGVAGPGRHGARTGQDDPRRRAG